MANLNVKFGNIDFKNPVVMASGTFGFGKEYNEIYDIQKLGGVSSKGLTLQKRDGNNGMRVWETLSGMMNSVGLENPGIQGFIDNELQFFKDLDFVRIANVGGGTLEDYIEGVKLLNDQPVDMIELNISCPNVKDGGMAFGANPEVAGRVTREVRKVTTKPLVVKLSPNVTDIAYIAKVVEENGADAVSLINTLLGMAIDLKTKKPLLGNTFGGFSGPAVKPVALRMVYQVYKAVNIPIVGMGGISSTEDALEFIMAGASMVSLGTGIFFNPVLPVEVAEGLQKYCEENNIENINELVGIAHR